METDKKSSACVSLTVFCFLINKLIIKTWESTSTFSLNGETWFPLTMKLSYLNIDPDEREGDAKAILYNRL